MLAIFCFIIGLGYNMPLSYWIIGALCMLLDERN
jgi:hypothetical protein